MRKFKKKRVISVAAFIICLALMTSCKKDKAVDEPMDYGQIGQEEDADSTEDAAAPEDETSETENDAVTGEEETGSDINSDEKNPPVNSGSIGNNGNTGNAGNTGTKAPDASGGTLEIYTIDANTLTAQPFKANLAKEEEITPDTIVSKVTEALAADNLNIKIDKITQNGDTVIVSFKSDHAPLVDLGASEESAVLDCISMSLLDNLETCKYVVFQADGGPYTSGHFEFDLNDAYKWK